MEDTHVKSHVESTFVKKEDVSNNDYRLEMLEMECFTRLHGFGGTSTDSIDDASAHKTTIRLGFCAPDHASKTYYRTPNQHRSTSEVR
jgi:hypothetical protein